MDLYTICHVAVPKKQLQIPGLDTSKMGKQNRRHLLKAYQVSVHSRRETSNYAFNKETVPVQSVLHSQDDFQILLLTDFYYVCSSMGPNYATCSACANSTNAIANAFNRDSFVRLMGYGGSEAAIAAAV